MKDFRRLYLTRIADWFDCDVCLEPANFLEPFRKLQSDELADEESLYGVKYNVDLVQAGNGVKYRFEAYEKL